METFTLLWRSQLAPTPRARRRTKTRTRNLFGTTAVSRQISAHTHTTAFWPVQNFSYSGSMGCPLQVIEPSWLYWSCCFGLQSPALWRTHAREDFGRRRKRRFWHFHFTPIIHAFPSVSFASCLMIHHFPWLSSNKTFIFHKAGTGESEN